MSLSSPLHTHWSPDRDKYVVVRRPVHDNRSRGEIVHQDLSEHFARTRAELYSSCDAKNNYWALPYREY
jgi:hypothetical protein